MPCLANPPALAELLSLSAHSSRNPTSQLQGLKRPKWHEGGMGHADGAFGPVPRPTTSLSSENLIYSVVPPLFFVTVWRNQGLPFKVLCFTTFHFMSKSHKENILAQIILTFLSFLVNSTGCYLLNIDCQIKVCAETKYMKFMFI